MQETNQIQPFTFSGSGGEYFRIWIVNLFLTILTLGIYSAWAKVRRTQYFYRHTSVAGASFDYHGDPKAILKGRIIAAILFSAYSVAGKISIGAGLTALALLLAVMPWLLVRSMRFRLHNTSYRGLRFSFHGKISDGYVNFLLMPLIGYISLFLLMPLAHQQIRRYLTRNSRFGNESFDFHAKAGAFYKPYFVVFAFFILFFGTAIGAAIFLAQGATFDQKKMGSLIFGFVLIAYLGFLLFIVPYIYARMQNLIWNATTLGLHRFESRVSARGMFYVMFSNILLIVLTLGLYKPFADIRLMRYRLEHLSLDTFGDFEDFMAGQQTLATATGEEMADMFDLDIAL